MTAAALLILAAFFSAALVAFVWGKPEQPSVAAEQRRRRLHNQAREQSWQRTPWFPPGDEF